MFSKHYAINQSEMEAILANAKQYDKVEVQIQPARKETRGTWLNLIFYTAEGQPDIAMTFPEVF